MLLFAFLLQALPAADDAPMSTVVAPPRVFEKQRPIPLAPPEPAVPTLPLLRAVETAPAAPLERRTKVEDGALQVVFGERAVFLLSPEDGEPRLTAIEPGRLASAHPPGAVRETFAAPPPGRLAAALDGSAQTGRSVLKMWNSAERPLAYRVEVLVLRGGKIESLVAAACALAPGQVREQSWPSAVAAVSLSRFTPPEPNAISQAGCV